MELGKVVGTVVATIKEPKLVGAKLLVVNILNLDGSATKSFVVAIDSVGAGKGERVIIVRGSSARQARNMESIPTDATIIGIVDTLEMAGKVVFEK